MEPIWAKTLSKTRLRNRLYDRLAQALQEHGEVLVGLPFRPLEHREIWTADVGFLAAPRALQTDPEDCLAGSPDLVAILLEPTHRVEEVNEWMDLCFDAGAVEFWVVEPGRTIVQVSYRDGTGRWYAPGEFIPLRVAAGRHIAVEHIFGEPEAD